MTNKLDILQKISRYLFFIAVILLFLPFIYGFKNTKNEERRETFLVNPRYKDSVSKIVLETKDEKLTLFKNKGENYFFGSRENSFVFPVDQSKIDFLFIEFFKKRSAIVFDTDYNKTDEYGLDSFAISFFGENDQEEESVFSKILFGKTDATNAFIYFRAGETMHTSLGFRDKIYKTRDDFYPFLSTLQEQWADMKVIPTFFSKERTKDEVKNLFIVKTDESGFLKTISCSLEKKSSSCNTLYSLSASIIRERGVLENAKKEYSIKLLFLDNEGYFVDIYKGQDGSFYMIPPSKKSLDYVLAVSEWTAFRMMEYF